MYKYKDLRTELLGYFDYAKLLFKSKQYSVHIYTFGVINEFRGTGLAKEFFNRYKKLVKTELNVRIIYLDCATYNQIAIKFYESSGFTKIKLKKNYYNIFGKDYDSIEMVMYLGEYEHYNSWQKTRPVIVI